LAVALLVEEVASKTAVVADTAAVMNIMAADTVAALALDMVVEVAEVVVVIAMMSTVPAPAPIDAIVTAANTAVATVRNALIAPIGTEMIVTMVVRAAVVTVAAKSVAVAAVVTMAAAVRIVEVMESQLGLLGTVVKPTAVAMDTTNPVVITAKLVAMRLR
jgi:hypothetical protein